MKQKLKKWLAGAGAAAVLLIGASVPAAEPADDVLTLADVGDFAGQPYVELNGGVPNFTEEDLVAAEGYYEMYSPLDELGRPGMAIASVGRELMPEGKREAIGMVKPVGFSTVRYDDLIEDKYLYNRCHIIGWQLTGENANERNLITGTRYMNVEGMLPFENQVASYVKATGNHVLYRVTPVYEGSELVCQGLEMEALSLEDGGEGLQFHVFVYNVQPGIEIDYATGDSRRTEDSTSKEPDSGSDTNSGSQTDDDSGTDTDADVPQSTYVLNRNSHKFHYPSCESVSDMAEHNKIFSDEDRDTIVAQGYEPCKRCSP